MAIQKIFDFVIHAVRNLLDLPAQLDRRLRDRMRSLFFRPRGDILPAEVRKELERVMLARENSLEASSGVKIVPDDYVVELHPGTYQRRYRPEEKELVEGWQRFLGELLDTTNDRFGDRRYRFGRPVQVKIQPAGDLRPSQVRVHCRINAAPGTYVPAPPGRAAILTPWEARAERTALLVRPAQQAVNVTQPASGVGYLELLPAGPQWHLRLGTTVLGRAERADIRLDMPHVQEKRLISAEHAIIRCHAGRCVLFDGSPDGRRSANGTYVNGRRVPPEGHELSDGDVVVLAALDPDNPRPDLPGVVGLIFYAGNP
jgi:hypothetical protein